MNYRACIQASIDYIEEHLKEDLTTERYVYDRNTRGCLRDLHNPTTDGEEGIAPAIQGMWKYNIHETWFPNSGYEFAEDKADFELYPCTNKGEKVKIYTPIIKKQNA